MLTPLTKVEELATRHPVNGRIFDRDASPVTGCSVGRRGYPIPIQKRLGDNLPLMCCCVSSTPEERPLRYFPFWRPAKH